MLTFSINTFSAFFVLNILMKVPSRDVDPNLEIRKFLTHVQNISMKKWILGVEISVDEQTLKFQGRYIDKIWITYKREGDSFQYNALCQNGYTFSCRFVSEPLSTKYTQQGLFPVHAQVMGTFDKINSKFHRYGMDNLYRSTKFWKEVSNHPKKVMLHGVGRESAWGALSSVLQDESRSKEKSAKLSKTQN